MAQVLAQDLRLSIFDKAISGGLSNRFESDGNVLTQIENARVNKANYPWEKGKKKVVILPVDQDLDITIPDWWNFVRLGSLVSILGRIGFRGFTKSDFTDENGAISLSPGNLLSSNKMTYASCSYITQKKYEESPEIQIENGDLLLVKTGSSYGKAAIVENLPKESTINPQLVRIVSHGINTKYLLIVFSSMFGKNQFESFVTGTATPTFSQEKIANFIVPFPPIEEQARIVARVDELMAKIDEYEKIEKQLFELKKAFPGNMKDAILQAAMQGKLTEQLESDSEVLVREVQSDDMPYDIPESWVWSTIEETLTLVNGRAYKKTELLNKGKYKVLRVGNFFTNNSWYYSDMELEANKYCDTGDLLYAWSASFGPKIWDGEKCIFHYHIWKVEFDETVFVKKYLYYFLLSDVSIIKNYTTGSTMVHVSMENMKPRSIPVPPIEEQQRIVEKLDQLLPLCDSLEAIL